MESINVGADLSVIWPQFAQWLLTHAQYGLLQHANTDEEKTLIQPVSDLYKNRGSAIDFAVAVAYNYGKSRAAVYAASGFAAAAVAYDCGDRTKVREVRIAQAEYLLKLLRACK